MTGKQKLQRLYLKKIREWKAKADEAQKKMALYPPGRKFHKDAECDLFSAREQIKLLKWCIQEHCQENK